MLTRNAPLGAPCWIDLMTSDVDRSRTFYADLLGWESEDPNPEFGGYFNFTKDGARVAGGMPAQPDAGPSDIWSVYLSVADAGQTVAAAREHGGEVHVEAMPVADLGTMAVIADVAGAMIGMWQPGEHKGFEIVEQPGTPTWFELHTRNYDASVQFYRNVFGWTTKVESDTPQFRYTVLARGDATFAGIMDASSFLPDGVPSHWSVYFGVDDTDAALTRTVDLGGAVIIPGEDSPYGRLATAADSTGAVFKIVANSTVGR